MGRRLTRGLVSLMLAVALVSGRVEAGQPRVHTVYAGQRLGTIAKRYNISVEVLCHANRIEKCKLIRPGQKLIIPDRSDSDGSAALRLLDAGYLGGGNATDIPQPERRSETSASKPNPVELPSTHARPGVAKVKEHKVYSGQRLGSIAKRYGVSVEALCNANGISATSPIRPGQTLIIPDPSDPDGSVARRSADREPKVGGSEPAVRAAPAPPVSQPRRQQSASQSWKAYSKRPWRSGYVHVIGHHASWKGYLVGRGGRVLPASRRAISRVLAWPHQDKLMSSELLRRLAVVSDQFGGRPLRVVSGYRTRSYARESKHRLGRAVDFSVVGVPNNVLRDYLRTFDAAGLGYYPNSTFVHFDVRETSVHWIDDSGPGQAPRYRRRSAASPAESAASDAADTPQESSSSSDLAAPPSVSENESPAAENSPGGPAQGSAAE